MKNIRKWLALSVFLFGVLLLLCACGCEHEWQNATCTLPTTCALCGETAGQAAGHRYTETVVEEADCGTAGKKTLTCLICEEAHDEEIPPTGNHTNQLTSKTDPTCTEEGVEHFICTVCAAESEQILAPTGEHRYKGTETRRATCKSEGLMTYTCSMCADSYTEAIPMTTQHSYKSKVTAQPTCKEEGMRVYTCEDCGYSYPEAVPVLKTHSYTSEVSKTATCDENGLIVYNCTVCGHSSTQEYSLPVLDADKLYSSMNCTVGEVITYDRYGNPLKLGSCFVLTADGQLVTNFHVIEGAASAQVTIDGERYTVSSILAYSVKADLAVLKVEAEGLTPATVCRKLHSTGKKVFAIGSSQGLTATLSRGMITYAQRVLDGVHYIQHDAPISGGSSGGPLINEYGEVIGINAMTSLIYENMNFAISVTELDNLDFSHPCGFDDLPQAENPTPTPDPEPDPNPEPKDGYKILVNYMMQQGSSGQGSQVRVKQFESYSDETGSVKFYAFYYPSTGVIQLILSITMKDTGYNVTVTLHIDNDGDGMYKWEYSDTDYARMYGFLYPDTYTEDTLLQHTVSTAMSDDMKLYCRQFSSLMIAGMCNGMNETFAFLGIGAPDFGFRHFSAAASNDPVIPSVPGGDESNLGSLDQIDNGVLEEVSAETMDVPENMKFLGSGNATEENNADNITATVVLYTLDGDVVNWKTEDDLIYVITEGNNRLVIINSDTMTPIYNVPLAGVPAEMNFEDDKIYISLPDLCRIDVFSKSDCAKVSSIYFDHEITSFCLDGDYIYYSEKDQHCRVFRKNLSTGELTRVQTDKIYSFFYPKVYLNEEDRILYIGESGSTGCALYYFDADTLALKSVFEKNDYGIMNHTREIFHFGDEIFWGGYRLSDTNAKELVGKYGTADYGSVTFASDELVSTYEGLFLTDTYECVIDYFDAGFKFEYILVSESYNVFFRQRIGDKNIIIGINFALQNIPTTVI